MATRISQRELRNDNADIMRRIEQGETFIVTRNGVAVADLLPHVSADRRRFVPVQEIGAALHGIGDWGVEAFYQERADLDNALDDTDVDPWASVRHAPR